MTIVEVGVDCDGTCDVAEELRASISEAVRHLRDGDSESALTELLAVAPDAMARRDRQRNAEFAHLYADWLKCDPPRTDFLTWAHKRRKHTLA